MYTYLLIMSLYGTGYPLEHQNMINADQCIFYGAAMSKVSPTEDYYFVCAPIEIDGMTSSGEPTYDLGKGTIFGGGKVPSDYKNVKIISAGQQEEILKLYGNQ